MPRVASFDVRVPPSNFTSAMVGAFSDASIPTMKYLFFAVAQNIGPASRRCSPGSSLRKAMPLAPPFCGFTAYASDVMSPIVSPSCDTKPVGKSTRRKAGAAVPRTVAFTVPRYVESCIAYCSVTSVAPLVAWNVTSCSPFARVARCALNVSFDRSIVSFPASTR